jgi:hypothetical protein
MIMMMQNSKTAFCCSKFPWARERKSPGSYRQFGHALSKRCVNPGLQIANTLQTNAKKIFPTAHALYLCVDK